MKRLALFLGFNTFAFAFFPFEAEDGGTLGGFGRFQVELNYANFKNYDLSRRQSLDVQFQAGVSKSLDLGIIQPFVLIKEKDKRLEGADDLKVFVKHIPFEKKEWRMGYRAQLNLDTGKRGIGDGRVSTNFNLIIEKIICGLVLNMNAVYIKSSHIEGLRDAYGVILHAYGDITSYLTLGVELKYLRPEERSYNKDTHILLGGVLRPTKSIDLSFGVHKSLNKNEYISNYGVLAGFLYRF